MPVSRPPPPSHRVSGNCLSGVDCGVPYHGLTHDDLAGDEIAGAEGSPRVVSVDAEYDALGPAWRQLVFGFESPQVSDGSKRKEVIERGPIPTQSSYGETPRLREIVVQRFYISLVQLMASTQRRALLPAVTPRRRAPVSRRSPCARSTTPLY